MADWIFGHFKPLVKYKTAGADQQCDILDLLRQKLTCCISEGPSEERGAVICGRLGVVLGVYGFGFLRFWVYKFGHFSVQSASLFYFCDMDGFFRAFFF